MKVEKLRDALFPFKSSPGLMSELARNCAARKEEHDDEIRRAAPAPTAVAHNFLCGIQLTVFCLAKFPVRVWGIYLNVHPA